MRRLKLFDISFSLFLLLPSSNWKSTTTRTRGGRVIFQSFLIASAIIRLPRSFFGSAKRCTFSLFLLLLFPWDLRRPNYRNYGRTFSLFLLLHLVISSRYSSNNLSSLLSFQSFLIASGSQGRWDVQRAWGSVSLSVFSYCFWHQDYSSSSTHTHTTSKLSVFSYCFSFWRTGSIRILRSWGMSLFHRSPSTYHHQLQDWEFRGGRRRFQSFLIASQFDLEQLQKSALVEGGDFQSFLIASNSIWSLLVTACRVVKA